MLVRAKQRRGLLMGMASPTVIVILAANVVAADRGGLQAEAGLIARKHLRAFGDGYHAARDSKRNLLYVTALDRDRLGQTAQLLTAFADAFQKTLRTDPPKWNITIVLPTTADYRRISLHKSARGYYRWADRTLISIDHGRVLMHEFTHALHHADLADTPQDHAVWVCEGLATLFEGGRLVS